MSKTPGFTIIEITIVMLVGSIMITALYLFFKNMSNQNKYAQEMISIVEESSIATNQIERDLSAIFVPEDTLKYFAQKLAAEKKGEKKTVIKQDEETPTFPFLCSVKNKQFDYLAFITTNRLPRYQRRSSLPVLVVYRFTPDELRQGIFHLVRYETDDLDMPIEKLLKGNVPGYRILSNLSSLTLKFTVPAAENTGEDKKEKKEASPLEEWNPEEVFKKHKALIPSFVEFDGKINMRTKAPKINFPLICRIETFEHHIAEMVEMHKEFIEEEKDTEKTSQKEKQPKAGQQVQTPHQPQRPIQRQHPLYGQATQLPPLSNTPPKSTRFIQVPRGVYGQ